MIVKDQPKVPRLCEEQRPCGALLITPWEQLSHTAICAAISAVSFIAGWPKWIGYLSGGLALASLYDYVHSQIRWRRFLREAEAYLRQLAEEDRGADRSVTDPKVK